MILVTGGAGFVGHHAVRRLRAAGEAVRVLDDLSAGRRGRVPPDVEFTQASVLDAAAVAEAVAGATGVVHLAALTSVPESLEDPVRYLRVNVEGTQVVLEAARRAGVRRVVLASSAAVYGAPRRLPQSEADGAAPESPYGLTKRVNEEQARLAARAGLSCVALRLFNVFGPGQDPTSPYASVVPRFLAQAAAGQPLSVHGDGSQTRDFVFVEDVAEAVARCLDPGLAVPAVLNVASGTERSVADVAEAVLAASGSRAGVRNGPARAGDVARSVADVALLRRLLPDVAPRPFEAALRATWESVAGGRGPGQSPSRPRT